MHTDSYQMAAPSSNRQLPTSNIQCIILAAGQGTRMKSTRPKVLHTLAGRAMIDYVIDAVSSISSRLRPIVVIGFGAEEVQRTIGDRVEYVRQTEQKGTGHAVLQASQTLDPRAE